MLGKLVGGLQSKGMVLADKLLSNNSQVIDNIQLLLGTDASHCVTGTDVVFGELNPSVFIESHAGIMLAGNVDLMLRNLEILNAKPKALHSVSDCSTNCPTLHVYSSSFFLNTKIDILAENDHEGEFKVNSSLSVVSDKGKLLENKLQQATDEILESECEFYLNCDQNVYNDESSDLNNQLVDFTLKNIQRKADGRLEVPLLWNGKVSHLLSKMKDFLRSYLGLT